MDTIIIMQDIKGGVLLDSYTIWIFSEGNPREITQVPGDKGRQVIRELGAVKFNPKSWLVQVKPGTFKIS